MCQSRLNSPQILHVLALFLHKKPPNLGTYILKPKEIAVMWQNFTNNGRSEKKNICRVVIKSPVTEVHANSECSATSSSSNSSGDLQGAAKK